MEANLNALKDIIHKEDVIESYNYVSCNDYSVIIRSKNHQKDKTSSEWCDDWIRNFGIGTTTNWIVRYTYPSLTKFEYKKVFKCHHNDFNKVAEFKKCSTRIRNKGCDAKVVFLFKKLNPNTIKNDPHLKDGYNIVITVRDNLLFI